MLDVWKLKGYLGLPLVSRQVVILAYSECRGDGGVSERCQAPLPSGLVGFSDSWQKNSRQEEHKCA